MSKISLQMFTMREHTKTWEDFKNTISKLREIGFETLQYSIPDAFDAKEVKKVFDSFGIINDSVFCPSLKLEDRLNTTIEQCELFNTKYVRIDSIQRGLTDNASGYKMFAHYLNEVSKEYKSKGIKIVYHFHSFEFKRFGNKKGIDILIDETDPEAIQIIPDTHWIQSGGSVITEFLEQYKDRFDYVHVKDFAIGAMGEKWEARPIEFAPVGEGNLNWKPIVDLCKRLDVKSYAIEQDDTYGRDAFACVKSSFDFLKKIGVDD
ncbi:MAG: sugar phosphate isomerase/epimerase [Ruminococcaceae bacterium]|nr:sugar phosphate isomerase/epimerase [Oscillospiraceae bacterium]